MRTDLSHRIDDVVVPFLKLCGWTALTIGASDAVTDKKLLLDSVFSHQTLEGLKSLGVLLTAASGFALNKSNDYYKECREKLNLSINGDLENALKNALLRAIDTVRDDYIKTKKEQGGQEASTSLFFDKLKERLKANTVEDHHIEAYAVNRSFFLQEYTQGQQYSDLDVSEDVVEYLSREFPDAITHAFLKELKGSAKAEIVYRTILSEMSVRQGQLTNETLQIIQADLLRLADGSETVQEQLHRIYHLLQLIQQILIKQSVDLSARFRQLETLFKDTSQPSLTDYAQDYKQAEARFQYHYKTGYTTFIGRQKELEQVETFVLPSADAPFRWWLLTGPGGMGKSRLAQEVCLQFNPYETWYAGFLDAKQLHDFSWRTWVPKHHTLIVVDYVSTRVKEVEEMLTTLYERRTAFNQKSVRVLLLERDVNGTWWERLQKSIGASASRYAKPLELSPFTDENRWQIVEEVHGKVTDEHRQAGKPLPRPLPDRTETLRTLAELDKQERPLFAFFVGMALAAGKTISDWNVNQLLEHILDEHERKRWREKTDTTVLEKHERLLALATITHGLTSSHWRTLKKAKISLLPDDIDVDLYHRMTGVVNSLTEKRYLPLEPDILGEFLVKQVFEKILNDDNYEPEIVQELVWLAWRFHCTETWAFTERLLGDFPDTPFLSLLWAPFPTNFWTGQQAEELLKIALSWSRFQVNLTSQRYSFAYSILESILDKPDQIDQLRKESGFVDNLELADCQAKAASNLINRLGVQKDLLKQAEAYYGKIEQLRKEGMFADKIELASLQAQAAKLLVYHLGAHKDFLKQAETYYSKIEQLRQDPSFIDKPEIALWQVQTAVSLIYYFGVYKDKNLMNRAEAYYNKIEQLCQEPAFADELELAVWQAKAATNLTGYLGAYEGLLGKAEAYFDKIEQLRKKPNLAKKLELASLQAQTAVNLIGHLQVDKELLSRAEVYYNKVEQLRKEPGFADKLELAVWQVQAATNLISTLSAHKDLLNQAEIYYQKVISLVDEYWTLDMIKASSRPNRILLSCYLTYFRNSAISQEIVSKRIKDLYTTAVRLYDIGKQENDPGIQIEFGIVVFTLINKPTAEYSPELIQYWHEILRNLLQNFANYSENNWQQVWRPALIKYFQRLSDSVPFIEQTSRIIVTRSE